MIVSNKLEYDNCLNSIYGRKCIIHVISNNDEFHGAVSHPLALFIRNTESETTHVININHYDSAFKVNKEQIIDDFNSTSCVKFVLNKKRFLHVLPLKQLKDLQLIEFIDNGVIHEDNYVTDGYKFYYNKFKNSEILNSAIPLSIHNKIFDAICSAYDDTIADYKEDEGYNNINDIIIENLQKIEKNGLFVDRHLFDTHFGDKGVIPINNLVHTEYNIYTSTGRPSNRFGGINYAAMNKENGCRNSFISRYGKDGMLLLMDYSAYHPHIVARLTRYDIPHDAYAYLGRYYYKKDELTPEEIKSAKNMTFQCMYGNIPNELKDIPYYKKMVEYIDHRWQYFTENGYVETPIYKRRITNKHIGDASPTKLFNYILQASETEFGMSVMTNIHEFLQDKLTKVVLYTYDSLLYDVHKDDGKETLVKIKNIMSQSGFPVKCYVGYNYHTMIPINI